MAYDKVVDSAQLETALTTMANAIREKTGDTEVLEWVSDKGFAEVISAIESGGGVKFSCGKFTLSESLTNYTITHGLGNVPDFFVLLGDFSYSTKEDKRLMCTIYYILSYSETNKGGQQHTAYHSATSGKFNVGKGSYKIEKPSIGISSEFITMYGANEQTVNFGSVGNLVLQHTSPHYWFAGYVGTEGHIGHI